MTENVSILAQVDATELFWGDNVNWRFCKEHANFAHREACEFILHIGDTCGFRCQDSESYFRDTITKMRHYGCTEAFIAAYEATERLGAARVLFYA